MLSIRQATSDEVSAARKAKMTFAMPKLERLRFKATTCGEPTGHRSYYICGEATCKDCSNVSLAKEMQIAIDRSNAE